MTAHLSPDVLAEQDCWPALGLDRPEPTEADLEREHSAYRRSTVAWWRKRTPAQKDTYRQSDPDWVAQVERWARGQR